MARRITPQTLPLTDLDARKSRGAFYTPDEIADFIVDWAVRSKTDRVLEPSCGDAAFLVPTAERLSSLGATQRQIGGSLHGIDIHQPAIDGARSQLASHGHSAQFRCSDFFDVQPEHLFDAVVGNPPFVRYQQFSGSGRAKSIEAALSQGVRLTQLASAWAAFVVHSASFLKDDGRLGFVLPAELLTVKYASDVRRFLLSRFKRVRLVLFETLVFPGVLEEVVLLLAEGRGGASSFEVFQARDAESLSQITTSQWRDYSPVKDEKWTPAYLPDDALSTYRKAVASRGFNQLQDWGITNLGIVTGNNDFFTLTAEEAAKWKLDSSEVRPISPPGGRHLKGLSFSSTAWSNLAKKGSRCFIFAPTAGSLSSGAKNFIKAGEGQGVHLTYKCRVRKPWWKVPINAAPDLFFTYMNHDRPRLTTNDGGVHILNSLYGITLKSDVRDLGRATLPIACLNSLTLAGSELVGRAYGGGLLKHEPREADVVPVPSAQTVREVESELTALKPQLSTHLRNDRLAEASELVDQLILVKALGMSAKQVAGLREARSILMSRRVSRGKTARGNV